MERYDVLPPALKEALMQKMKTDSPFWTLLGMELVDARKGWARMRLPFDRKLVHPMGIAHGGAIFSIADSAVAMALIGMVDRGDAFVTVEMKLILRPSRRSRGGPDHPPGQKTALGDVEVRNDRDELVAKGLASLHDPQGGRRQRAKTKNARKGLPADGRGYITPNAGGRGSPRRRGMHPRSIEFEGPPWFRTARREPT